MPKSTGCFIAAAALALIAWAPALAQDAIKIATEAQFREMLVGKKLTTETGHQVFAADGSLSGTFRGTDYTGSWKWEGEGYCRDLTFKGRKQPRRCFTLSVTGRAVTNLREDGRTYHLEMPAE